MIIAIDMGGTKIRAGKVEGNNVTDVLFEPCRSNGSEQEVLDQVFSMIDELYSPEIRAIGIGVPSIVDPEEGIVYNTIGIPSWKEVHLKEKVERKYGIPTFVDNDCNCFAMGASLMKEVSGLSNLVCITLGTGVGAGLILNGRLYHGENTGAGEIGSIPYLDKDYEFYCSSRFFEMHGTTGKDAEWDAVEGKAFALDIWKEFGTHLGKLIKLILLAYDPAAIVIGGGISRSFDFFKDSMYEEMNSFQYPSSLKKLNIICCTQEFIQLFGAAALCNDIARFED